VETSREWVRSTYYHQYQVKSSDISGVETAILKAEAKKYDLALPRTNKGWWISDPHWEFDTDDAPVVLTEEGKAGITKLIKEERRADHDWWIKTLALIFTVLTGFAGAISGLTSFTTATE
jgi:hypothetical protein